MAMLAVIGSPNTTEPVEANQRNNNETDVAAEAHIYTTALCDDSISVMCDGGVMSTLM